jgi:hypothetical protein
MSLRIGRSFLFVAVLHLAATAATAATLHVDSTLDQPDDDAIDGICHTISNTCTLRAAVMQANLASEDTFIYVPAGTYTLTRPPFGANGAESGDLNFAQPGNVEVFVYGGGTDATIIDGNQLDRVIRVESGSRVRFFSLTIRNGLVTEEGGGILMLGGTTLERVTVRDNQAGIGGGVLALGTYFIVSESTIRDNRATSTGGGLCVAATTGQVVNRSTISGNSAEDVSGGGIWVSHGANLSIIESTISSNRAAVSGGAILVGAGATLNIYNSTIAFNMADSNDDGDGDGGGILALTGDSTINIRNSLIAGNYLVAFFDWDDCVGTIGTYGRNLVWDAAGCSLVGGPGTWGFLNDLGWIGPLAKNGGATQTHELYPGSNAIEGGDPVDGCLSPAGGTFAVDQRGMPRVHGVRCDIGAYEAGILFADGFELGDRSAWD